MRYLVLIVLSTMIGCGEAPTVPPVANRPPAKGDPPRPWAPGQSKGEWEDPRLKELRTTSPTTKEHGR